MSRHRLLFCFAFVACLMLPAPAGATVADPFAISDPMFSTQWGLWNSQNSGEDIGAPLAWKYSTGAGATVAVVDDGIYYTHPDLQDRFVANSNPGEIPDNGIDDDGNGYIDDTRGWDFALDDNNPMPDVMNTDGGFHGTHIAGIIAASHNSIGTIGVAPDAKLMALKVDGTTNRMEDKIAEAFNYAGDMGVDVVNLSMSFTGRFPHPGMRQAILDHPDTLYVFSAGNASHKIFSEEVDDTHSFPCSINLSNVLCVGATGRRDLEGEHRNPLLGCHGFYANDCLISISNYSDRNGPVQIYAPGGEINSTVPPGSNFGNEYDYKTGTSMATPMVVGVAALLASDHPTWTATQIKQRIIDTADWSARNWNLADGDPEKILPRLNAGWALSGQPDNDRDTVLESADNCPASFNLDQADRDQDGVGNVCDGTPDGPDTDGDGRGQLVDNCPNNANSNQADRDQDGVGDACDSTPDGPDTDGDGRGQLIDNCPNNANSNQADHDQDGVGDVCDTTPDGPDADGDGQADLVDNCPYLANPLQENWDRKGAGDACASSILLKWSSRAHNSRRTISGKVWVSAPGRMTVTLYTKKGNRWRLYQTSYQNVRRGDNMVQKRVRAGRWYIAVSVKGRYGRSARQQTGQIAVR